MDADSKEAGAHNTVRVSNDDFRNSFQKKQLGPKFDLRQFHEVVLTKGAVPLDVLEELIDKSISATKGGGS